MEVTEQFSRERKIGEHAARLDIMEADIAEIKTDVKSILLQLAEAKGAFRGGWATITTVGGVAGLIGAMATKIASAMGIMPK